MKKFNRVFCLLLCIILAASQASCSDKRNDVSDGTDKKKYTLTVWGSSEDKAMLLEMCEEYARENPDNVYEFLYGVEGEGEIADKLLNDPSSGPDIYSFASDQLYKLYSSGALARIGGDAEKELRRLNDEGSIDAASVTINGENMLYAYPSTGDNCCFLYYDKSVFTNTEDLQTLDGILKRSADVGKKVHFKLNEDGWYLSTFFFALPSLSYEVGYNENLVQTFCKINFDSDDGLEVMRALRTYIYNDTLLVQTDDSKMTAAFTADKNGDREASAVVSGIWNAETFKKLLGEDLGVCKLPTATIGGKQAQLSGFMGYKLIGVNGFSENKGEAHKLAQFLTNEKNQLKRYEVRGFAPTNKAASENDKIKNDVILKAVFEQAEHNRVQKGVPSSYWSPMGSLLTPIIIARANGQTVTDEQLMRYLTSLTSQIRQ